MTTPQRIRLSRTKGFNLQKFSLELNGLPAVNCARPSRWGNPNKVDRHLNVFQVVDLYRDQLARSKLYDLNNFMQWLAPLRGKNLACWCKASPCHLDVLFDVLKETS